jgi:hypothetical protein
MRKKVTNEQVEKLIFEVSDKIRRDMDLEFRVAYSQMGIAENDLVQTFDENQMKLFKDFCEKRKHFYSIASELYERKF